MNWDVDSKGIFTAHGFSKYQLSFWNLEKDELVFEFIGHKNRILSMVRPSSEGSIITGSADETIRVWNMKSFTKKFGKGESDIKTMMLR